MSEKMKMGSEQELNAMWNLLKAAVSDLPDGRRQNVLVGIANYAEAYAAGIRAAVLAEVRAVVPVVYGSNREDTYQDGIKDGRADAYNRIRDALATLENPNE